MDYNFICPYCTAQLRIENCLIMMIHTKSKFKGLIIMNPTLGNYYVATHDTIKFKKGEAADFFCPVCHSNLIASSVNPNLIKLLVENDKGKRFDMFFSRIAGERSTFITDEDQIIEQYGEHTSTYSSFFTQKTESG